MSSRLRKKRNANANRVRAMSTRSVASLLKDAHGPSGCSYGVHSWEYDLERRTKTCVKPLGYVPGLCGATYMLTDAEIRMVRSRAQMS